MKKPIPQIAFKIDGKPAELDHLSPTIRRAFEALDKLPDGELLTAVQLSKRAKASQDALRNVAPGADWQGRRIKHGTRMLYGNAKTIEAYRTHFGL
jgi:hypothetical protein